MAPDWGLTLAVKLVPLPHSCKAVEELLGLSEAGARRPGDNRKGHPGKVTALCMPISIQDKGI